MFSPALHTDELGPSKQSLKFSQRKTARPFKIHCSPWRVDDREEDVTVEQRLRVFVATDALPLQPCSCHAFTVHPRTPTSAESGS